MVFYYFDRHGVDETGQPFRFFGSKEGHQGYEAVLPLKGWESIHKKIDPQEAQPINIKTLTDYRLIPFYVNDICLRKEHVEIAFQNQPNVAKDPETEDPTHRKKVRTKGK
jgi:hypothetical protein